MRKDWEEKTSPEYYSNGKDAPSIRIGLSAICCHISSPPKVTNFRAYAASV